MCVMLHYANAESNFKQFMLTDNISQLKESNSPAEHMFSTRLWPANCYSRSRNHAGKPWLFSRATPSVGLKLVVFSN